MDIDLVAEADSTQQLSEKMAVFLFDSLNPLDQKLALINALGWRFEGLNNTQTYRNYLERQYQKPLDTLKPLEISASDQVVLGYLMLMDDYFHPQKSLILMRRGARRLWQSQTAQLILALGESQDYLPDFGAWCQIWLISKPALDAQDLKPDMRPEAVEIIREYLILYQEYCPQ